MSKNIFGIVTLLIFVGCFQSCILGRKMTHKRAVADTTANKATDTAAVVLAPLMPAPAANTDKKRLIDSLMPIWQKHFAYNTFVGKAKMHYAGGDMDQEFTANFRVKKDSVIWIAVTALGGMLQIARAYITPDSLYLVNYIQKEAYRMPISQAAKLLPVPADFATLQNLIVGDVLDSTGNITDAANIGDVWSIQVDSKNYTQQITYNKADSTMRSGLLRTQGADGVQANVQYSNYNITDDRHFAMDRNINIRHAGSLYVLEMSFVNANFNQPLEYPFSIPRNYTIK